MKERKKERKKKYSLICWQHRKMASLTLLCVLSLNVFDTEYNRIRHRIRQSKQSEPNNPNAKIHTSNFEWVYVYKWLRYQRLCVKMNKTNVMRYSISKCINTYASDFSSCLNVNTRVDGAHTHTHTHIHTYTKYMCSHIHNYNYQCFKIE